MKKLIIIISLLIASSFPHFAFSMQDERTESSSYVRSKPAHKFSYSERNHTLRSPKTEEEWKSYHAIRIAEIHNRYCQGYTYDYENPDEKQETNFPFVLLNSSGMVVGVIRVDLLQAKKKDLLPGKEAALRWVAIHKDFQKQGLGTWMLTLAERFITEQERLLIRVPAEDDSEGFYKKRGYIPMDWPEGPHHPGEVSLVKWLQ